jgi:catechol 2,3-dioxygenase-like lactoylglutathione lyase family enzyme
MEQRISMITLGVADVSRARTFYERLGWRGQEAEETVFFQAGAMAVVLWARHKLAADAGIEDSKAGGFGGIALAHNVRSRAEVDELLASAAGAGAQITQAARETFYGGYLELLPGSDHVWRSQPGLGPDGSITIPDFRAS